MCLHAVHTIIVHWSQEKLILKMCGISGLWQARSSSITCRRMTSLPGYTSAFFCPFQNVFYYIRPKFPSRKDKNIAGTVWLILGAFAKVSPPDIFLLPLQNHSRHGNKCSVFCHWISTHETLGKGSWSPGAICLLWVVHSDSAGPGGGPWLKKTWAKNMILPLRCRKIKSKQEPRLALKCWLQLSEGKERMRCLGCLNSCNESAALLPCPSLAAQQPPPSQVKQSDPKKRNLPQCSRITLQDRTSPQTRRKGKWCFQMREEAGVTVDFWTGTAKRIFTSSGREREKK